MTQKTTAISASVLSALSHPNRIKILECLREGARCNCELAPALGLEQSNLSRHLKILVDAGILRSTKTGYRVNFEIVDKRVFRLLVLAQDLAKRELTRRAEVLKSA